MSQRLQPQHRPARALRSARPAAQLAAPFPLRRSALNPLSPQVLLGLTIGAMLVAAPLANAQTSSAAEPAATADNAVTLAPITVQEKAAQVAAPYAGGQVTTGGRVGLLGDKDFMETPFSTIGYTEKYIEDRQAQNITDVIAATDPTVFSNGVSGAWAENYSIRASRPAPPT